MNYKYSFILVVLFILLLRIPFDVNAFSANVKTSSAVVKIWDRLLLTPWTGNTVVGKKDFLLKKVYIVNKQKVRVFITQYKTVRDFLVYGLHLNPNNVIVDAPLGSTIFDGTLIKIVYITRKVEETYVDIPYKTIEKEDNTIELDKKVIKQQGRLGKKYIQYEYVYHDGKLVDKKVIKEKIIVKPQAKIVLVGTKKVCHSTIVSGRPISYWKKLHVWATSYDHTCYGCNHWTATGKYLTKGIIAVDPRVIKMHTTMYVPGYGFGQAEDTGGAIKGNHIDLGFDDLNTGFWSARWVDIYLIDHCMPSVKFDWRTKWD